MADIETCPVCGARKVGETVFFQQGSRENLKFVSATSEKLQARVCQFNSEPGCINRDQGLNFSEEDEFGDAYIEEQLSSEFGFAQLDHEKLAEDLLEELRNG